MSQFASKSIMTIDQMTIRNNATANAGSKGDHYKIFHSLGSAIHHFTYCCGIGIICKCNRKFEFCFNHFCQWNDAAPGQVRCIFNRACVIITIRSSDTNSFDPSRSSGSFDHGMKIIVQFINKPFHFLMIP